VNVRLATAADLGVINDIYEAGRFAEQGRKFGRYWDVGWFERG